MRNNCKENKKQRKSVNIMLIISGLLFVLSVVVLLFSYYNPEFAEIYCRTVSACVRGVLSFITGFFTFSLIELLLFLSPVILAVIIITVFVKKKISYASFFKLLGSVILFALFIFINTFVVCYFRNPIEESLGLDRRLLSREELYETSMYLKSNLESNMENVEFSDDGSSVNPHTWNELDMLIDKGFTRLCKEYKFVSEIVSKPKRVMLSPLMTYTHISGMYMPITGEANVNTNYPDYVVAFTVAHEKAHQRGIAGEDDANFVAFMALLASGDDYLIYAALMNMYDYFLDSVYDNDREMYYYLIENTEDRVIGEMQSYYNFFEKYRNSKASKVADKVNDTYLKTMGENEGVMSYGKVVEIFAAYIEKNNGLPY